MSRNTKSTRAGIFLTIFLVFSIGSIFLIVTTIQPIGASGEISYRAEFTSASRLQAGDQVRVAGVVVGSVVSVDVTPRSTAMVTFSADSGLPLTTGTHAQIRYLNLIGDRYVSLTQGGGSRLSAGGLIGLPDTQPALDLNALFNGFRPLFAALSPNDVNQLAGEIVSTLQGEGGTIDQLLQHTAVLTSTIANKDTVIGRVVTNLNSVLATFDQHQAGMQQLVTQLDRFVGGLAGDRTAILDSISHINQMTAVTASLLKDARPSLRNDIVQLRRSAGELNAPVNAALLIKVLQTTPGKLQRIIRSGAYGSWFNFFVCDIRINLNPTSSSGGLLASLFDQVAAISLHDSSPRCSG
jgi:phospholipid/cholesterol/gamma-HCH transport system substrate-binding protein